MALAAPAPAPTQGGTPDYFSITAGNWAFSPQPQIGVDGVVPGTGIRKFVDTLPGLNAAGKNNLSQFIPVAIPDQTTYPGSDYYEIELGRYTEKMHSDLPPTTLLGYRQTNTSDATVNTFHYLGPMIIAQKDRPVRIKLTNNLPTGAAGKHFLPVDHTLMGAGPGPNMTGWDGTQQPDVLCKSQPGAPTPRLCFAENRGTLHLHGGRTPWISDGTPHQWITPAGEDTAYPKGASVVNVPDMPDPGPGAQTFYYTNQQSSRLMFYHDHALGLTRLNVYAGEAAGYLIRDPKEKELVDAGVIPAAEIPLIIQDKTFVDASTVLNTDPTWNWGTGTLDTATGIRQPKTGDLWWPHVYVPAQNPYDISGVNPTGRWVYGPWFWPPTTNIQYQPKPNPYCLPTPGADCSQTPWEGQLIPGTPDTSWGAEAFMDTPVVNGTAYPKLTVEPKAYRFRVLNASHDRFWNLQLYQPTGIVDKLTLLSGGSGYTADPVVTITGGNGKGATGKATVDSFGQVTGLTLLTTGSGYTSAPTVTIAPPPEGGTPATASAHAYTGATEVGMVPSVVTAGFPANWPRDGRDGGVPDPALMGPNFIQIGTEAGFLPKPAVIANQPVTWNMIPTTFNFGNVENHALLLGPAERADVIIDFSQYAGKTLILYNDAPAAFPAIDPRVDYYTGKPDHSMTPEGDGSGGTGTTLAGFGPNVRTVMQINVVGTAGPAFDLGKLEAAFASTADKKGVFAASQDPILVGQTAYDSAYNKTFPSTYPNWGVSRIQDNTLNIETVEGTVLTVPMKPKAIQDEMGEAYDEYGRMSTKLGLELPMTSSLNQNFVLQNYVDPATEILTDSVTTGSPVAGDGTQIWKITHNGVDTHPVHFHLFDVQLINRVGWDGAIRLPDDNELGWKDTVRISPLEDTIVALRPVAPRQPFGLPDSVRPLNPALPLNARMGFTNIDPTTGQPLTPTTVNEPYNFGWEYVWHCHILSHEEADMMRPIKFNVGRRLPQAPVVTYQKTGSLVNLTWTDGTPVGPDPNNPANLGDLSNEIGFRIERAAVNANGSTGSYSVLAKALANATEYTDNTAGAGTYRYRVVAYNAAGDSASASVPAPAGTPAVMISPSDRSTLTGSQVTFTWTAGTGVSTTYLWIGTTAGSRDLADVGGGSALSYTASVPTTGSDIYVRLWSVIGGDFQYRDYVYTTQTLTKAAMLTPAPGTVLPGAQATFTWDAGTGVSTTYLWIGTTAGSNNLANFGGGAATSYTVNLPTNGSTIYVRLWSVIGGAFQFTDYTYTAATLTKAAMLGPTPGSVLPGGTATFTWNAGSGVTTTYLWIGTTAGSNNLVNFGGGAATSYMANLPTDGSTLYVRLWSVIGGAFQFTDYTYTAVTLTKAAMLSPTPGSALPGSTTTFTWNAGTGASTTYLWIGTTAGSNNLVNFGGGAATSYTANLPADGSTIYVRLWSVIGGAYQFSDYTYSAANVVKATMVSPGGTTVTANPATFNWTAGTGLKTTYLWIGTTPGSNNLVNFGGGTATSYTGTLTTGITIYVRLWSQLPDNSYLYTDYTYTTN